MFKNTSKFQIIFFGAFIFFIIAGLLVFSTFSGGGGKDNAKITIWGTIDDQLFSNFAQEIIRKNGNKFELTYVEKSPDHFDNDLLEALAVGNGPDVILVSQDQILKHANKITTIPFDTLSAANFKSAFIQEAEVYLTPNGALAIPFSIDPMVMYWNRDIFSNAALSQPPKYWEEFLSVVPQLTKKDQAGNIIQSAVSLGEYQNILYAKDILNALIIQAGNPLVVETNGRYESTLSSTFNFSIAPANAALTFYTLFADPLKDTYTWNRGLRPDSKFLFQANKLAMYIGYASEYKELKEKNPNLNFDVTPLPQSKPAGSSQAVSITYGRMTSFSILRSSHNASTAYKLISLLTNKDSMSTWNKESGLPSIRRDAPAYASSDAASTVFAASALWARGWLDPDAAATDMIYKNLIEDITSGRRMTSDAIANAQLHLQELLDTVNNRNNQ